MDKYKKYRISLIKNRLCESLNVSSDWLEKFINQKNYCWGGRTLQDLIDEEEWETINNFIDNLNCLKI